MKVGEGEFTYDWIEHWARIPETVSGKTNGRTHGVVAIDSGPYKNQTGTENQTGTAADFE